MADNKGLLARAEKAEAEAEFFKAEVKLRNKIGMSQAERDAIWAEATAAAYGAAAEKANLAGLRVKSLKSSKVFLEVADAIRALTPQDASDHQAKLIADAVAQERERCAKIADDYTPEKRGGRTLAAHCTGRTISAAIRANEGGQTDD